MYFQKGGKYESISNLGYFNDNYFLIGDYQLGPRCAVVIEILFQSDPRRFGFKKKTPQIKAKWVVSS